MAAATDPIGAWEPLRDRRFRVAWGAFLGAQIVIWAQTVGAVDVITEQTDSATPVALIQTAISLPGVALALFAGAVADVVDRRRLLVGAGAAMAAAMTALALLRGADAATPAVVLALTAALGAGLAMFLPAFSAAVPDLLPRALISPAIAITNVSVNIARAAGPALAGAVIAAAGAGGLFWVLAGVLVAVTGMLAIGGPPSARPASPEPIAAAVRAGARYARFSTPLRATIARTTLFVAFGSAMWALLPVVAVRRLDLPASGFGVLLACVGTGAVAGAGLLPRLRAALSAERLTVLGSIALAGVLVALSLLRAPVAAGAILLLAGAVWITVLTVHITGAQAASADWVRGRAMATWLLAYQAGFAAGGLVWGVVADASLEAALLVPAGALVLSAVAGRVAALPPDGVALEAARHWADPVVATEVDPADGPVLVTVEYEVDEADAAAFVEAMQELSLLRRRDGAQRWELSRDLAEPQRYLETFTVATWGEHLRQHERGTQADLPVEQRAIGLARSYEVRHLIAARPV